MNANLLFNPPSLLYLFKLGPVLQQQIFGIVEQVVSQPLYIFTTLNYDQ